MDDSEKRAFNRKRNVVTVGKEEKPQRGQKESCLSSITDWNKDVPAGARATILKSQVLLLPLSFELGVLTQFNPKMEKLWWKCSFSWLWCFHKHMHMLKLIKVYTSNSVMYRMSIFPQSSYREFFCVVLNWHASVNRGRGCAQQDGKGFAWILVLWLFFVCFFFLIN